MKKQTCRSLLSLSPQYQHPPPFTNWPALNRLLFFYFFLITSLFPFFPFPILILPRLLSSSARLFVLCDTARQEGSVWMSVCESSFCLFFLLTPLVFLLLSVFGESKRWAGGPLNVHRERQGPPLSLFYSDYTCWSQLNNPFIEGRASCGNIAEIKRGFGVISL